MSYAQRLHLRLFLEGIEVPVISAQIQMQANQPAVASIQIPANDYALEFKPRTLVHLFFYDFYRGAPPEDRAFVAGEGITVRQQQEVDPELQSVLSDLRINEATPEQIQEDLENENYKLLYGGEIVGIQITKSPTTRGIVLQCMDWSSYWDFAFQYQVSGYSLGGGGIRAAFTGARTTVFNDFLEGSGDQTLRLMAQPPRSYPQLANTLLGALVHIIEAIGGIYYGSRAVRGVNDFFSLAEMRLHLTQMVGANPYSNRDETRLMRANGFGSLFRRGLRGLGKQVSIRKILNALQRYIFHDIFPCPAAHYLPPTTDPRIPSHERVSLDEDDAARPLARAARQLWERALELRDRQQATSDSSSSRSQSTRRGGLAREFDRLRRVSEAAARRANRVGDSSGDGRFERLFRLPGVAAKFEAAANNFRTLRRLTLLRQTRQLAATIEAAARGERVSAFRNAESPQAQQVIQILEQIMADMEVVLATRVRRRVRRTTSQPDPPPRLITQVWRPDVWMVAPPRCNVFFPELYSQFTYGRNFMQETTRLLLRTHSAFFGSDILFDGFYMAPSRSVGARTGRSVGRGRVNNPQPDVVDAPAWFIRDLMDHELYTGILPKFERMSNLNLHALRGLTSEIEGGVRVSYAALACNHIFFQQRFQSRQMQVSGKFNPFLVGGFPAVIIDKYKTRAELDPASFDSPEFRAAQRLAEAQAEGEGDIDGLPEEQRQEAREASLTRQTELVETLLAPTPSTHYLGTIGMLSHNVSVEGGGTSSAQMTYARSTNEETEFLGETESTTGRTSRFRRVRDRVVTTYVAWTREPSVGDRGPRGGEITEVEDVTERYRRRQRARRVRGRRGRTATGQERYRSNETLPLWVPGGTLNRRARYRGTRVIVGVEQAAAAYGPEVVALVGSIGTDQSGFIRRADGTREEITITFRAYRIRERIGTYRRVLAALPPEELVFPPWYGEHWRSNRVGGIYAYLFGVGSIVDQTTITAPGGDGRAIVIGDGGDTSGTTEPRTQQPDQPRPVSPTGTPAPGFNQQPETGGLHYGQPSQETDPSPEEAEVLAEIEARGTINNAIDELVRVYSRIRQERWDTNEFLRSYTWRPIASMVDVFGTSNLEITDDGEVVQGQEGFHSRAFGDFDDLRQLVQNTDGRLVRILGLTLEDPEDSRDADSRRRAERDAGIAARLDTRKEKRLFVFKYLQGLMSSRGILG